MGETASRLAAPAPLNPKKLTPRQLQQLLNNFGLNELSPSKARISLLAFVRAFPGVLQGHATLLLPTLKEIARHQQLPAQPHGQSFATLSSSSLVADVDGRVPTNIVGARCSKPSKKQVEALKIANSITLQEIIDSISSCCSGEAPETEVLLTERMLGRIARAFQPRWIQLEENEHLRNALETIGGVSLAPRACVSLIQLLHLGYLEMMFLINSSSLLFQDQVARTTSGLTCNEAQELHIRAHPTRGIHATSAWDSAPALKMVFPKELNFTFAIRAMASAFAEAAAPTTIHASTPTAAAVANAAVAVTQLAAHLSDGTHARTSSVELAAQASGALLHASSSTIGSGGLRHEVFAVLSWIRAALPALPALCTLGVAAHLLGDAVFDGQPQQERRDSSTTNVQYSVSPLWCLSGPRLYSLRGWLRNGAIVRTVLKWSAADPASCSVDARGATHKDAQCVCVSAQTKSLVTARDIDPKRTRSQWIDAYEGRYLPKLCALCVAAANHDAFPLSSQGTMDVPICLMEARELKEGGHVFFGDAGTCLFSLEPQLNILRTSGLGRNFVYLNTKNKFYPIGLGFGGQVGAFRLWIGDEMKGCYITKSDCTYSPGRMLQKMNEPIPQTFNPQDSVTALHSAVGGTNISSSSRPPGAASAWPTVAAPEPEASHTADFLVSINVKEIEIWGTGDASTLEQQRVLMKQQEQLRQERRQVDKGRLLDSNFDREFLLEMDSGTRVPIDVLRAEMGRMASSNSKCINMETVRINRFRA
ncbi:TLD domain-containing protein [Cyclospora cayetanensis]|uniref:TLD domain-containing protein n=1 Tax=Cyclospora cayetanensis TaxID=88456 RepID=A0A1D3D537_9EIME|nr:TLD domain-containing protein [Cyclospora cayetanensis]